MNIYFFLAIGLVINIVHADESAIVYLDPLPLDNARIIKGAFNRPRRIEGPNISREEKDSYTIVHCYGHGGYGFTTLFGSIAKAMELVHEKNLPSDTHIAVIGSGVMGLTLAIELTRLGYRNISMFTKDRYENISWRAGGFFDPGVGTEKKAQDLYKLHLGLQTFEVLFEIEQGLHAYLSSDIVRRLPIYYPEHINVGVEVLALRQLMPPSELVTIDFGNGVRYEHYKRQYTYFIDTTKLMHQLWQEAERLGISVIEKEITHFEECGASIVCNCTGLGAKNLLEDQVLEPARGHIFMIAAKPDEKPRDYLLFAPFVREERREYVSYFPKPSYATADGDIACLGVIGGTFIPCRGMSDNELAVLDQKEFMKLYDRAHTYFYGP